jgi:hypothetical protein
MSGAVRRRAGFGGVDVFVVFVVVVVGGVDVVFSPIRKSNEDALSASNWCVKIYISIVRLLSLLLIDVRSARRSQMNIKRAPDQRTVITNECTTNTRDTDSDDCRRIGRV